MKESSPDNDQNQTIIKQTSFISNTEQNISTNHTFRTIKKRIPWTEEEDKSIKSLVNKYGTSNWTLISNEMGQNRSGKQCRERWYNQLIPNVKKNNWTEEEENILFTKHMQYGNKWAEIGSFLPGRTLNDIKNHFYSKLRKFIRKILRQINDENLFKINGIDGCKYNGEKIYKMIKKHEITYNNLTKDTIFEMIIATEKNPKGKFIFFKDNSNNNSYNSNYCNNMGNNFIFNNNNEENINKEEESGINNNLLNILRNNQQINRKIKGKFFKDKKKKIKNTNNIMKTKINSINEENKCNIINDIKIRKKKLLNKKVCQLNIDNNKNNQMIENKSKVNNDIIKEYDLKKENINNKLIGQKRKKGNSQKSNNLNNSLNENKKIKYILELNKKSKEDNNNNSDNKNLILPEDIKINNKLKEKNKKRKSLKEEMKENLNFQNKNNPININNIKFQSKRENKENKENKENNNFCFYSPFKIPTPKTTKNLQFPSSETKSNRSLKPEDFSFNKINLLNDYLDSSQMQQLFPINMENILLCPQKNKNIFVPDLSFDNNNLLKSRGSCLGSIKNDNTYKNFSIDENLYNKIIMQNNINNSINNNMTVKSIDYKKIDKPTINLDLINQQDFTNTIINGNIINESQYNSVFYKNNQLNISSPSSMKSIWK